MAKIPSSTFVARVSFLAFCVLLSSALEAAAQHQPGGHHHHHHHHHGQHGFQGHNHQHISSQIPKGYTTFPGVGSYKFHARGADWKEALRTCSLEGTKMLLVNSNAEAEVVKTLCRKNPKSNGALNSNHVWVGVQEKGRHGQFIANNGQRLQDLGFLVWSTSPQQPNDPGNNDCVSFYVAGTLYDDACNIKYPFICEA